MMDLFSILPLTDRIWIVLGAIIIVFLVLLLRGLTITGRDNDENV